MIPDTSINKIEVPTKPNSATELEIVLTESQEPEAQIESTESQTIATEPKLPEKEDELQEDNNAKYSKGKESVLAKYVRRHHTPDQIIGDKSEGTMTRSKLKGTCLLANFKPRNVKDALENESWIEAMNEEIEKIEKNKTQTLAPRPKDKNLIGTKWVFRNKLNEEGQVSRNKARLVCKGYSQEEGVDYGETFSLVARLEGVRTLLAYAAYKGFKVYQMDVKSAFLNGILDEEVYIEKRRGFIDPDKKDMVCKLHKALYGLKQAPRAWYERLHNYLIQIGFQRTNDNSSLYIKQGPDNKIVLAEIFVDDTLFTGNDDLCQEFS